MLSTLHYVFKVVVAISALRLFADCRLVTGDDFQKTSNLIALQRVVRQVGKSLDRDCSRFTHVDAEKQEFYSPGYPGTYTNHTDCVLVLEAPPGHLIELDFRDWFELEYNDKCLNDFLVVRDGSHGYNNPIGQYCGNTFPPMITSTDRHLWLRFHSDENIEYRGFKAVYKFTPRPKTWPPENRPCRIYVNGSEGYIFREQIPDEAEQLAAEYKMALDCVWVITVKEGWRIQLQFSVFKLAKPNDCISNYVDVFSSHTDMNSREKNFCGSIADSVTSTSDIMYVRFYSENSAVKSTFKALFTAYHDSGGQPCGEGEYDCEDATCISLDLKCNGRNNCRFRWDEDECEEKQSLPGDQSNIIIIMVIFSLIVSGMCFTFIFNCVKKLISDHHAIQEHIRQSQDQHLNEIGQKHESIENKKHMKVERSHSNSTQSSDSHRLGGVTSANATCYVPGEMLPILLRGTDHSISSNLNGDPYTQQTYDTEVTQQPEMCDSACQTRESLFTTQAYSSEHSTPNHSVTSKPSPPAPFSTFGYTKENTYRAEAKIEMERIPDNTSSNTRKKIQDDKRRPYSVQTTKSAPDVIVTH